LGIQEIIPLLLGHLFSKAVEKMPEDINLGPIDMQIKTFLASF
jgi:hypothetical protein